MDPFEDVFPVGSIGHVQSSHLSHRIHVWYMYLLFTIKQSTILVDISKHMDAMGFKTFNVTNIPSHSIHVWYTYIYHILPLKLIKCR